MLGLEEHVLGKHPFATFFVLKELFYCCLKTNPEVCCRSCNCFAYLIAVLYKFSCVFLFWLFHLKVICVLNFNKLYFNKVVYNVQGSYFNKLSGSKFWWFLKTSHPVVLQIQCSILQFQLGGLLYFVDRFSGGTPT